MITPSRFVLLGEPLALDLVNTRVCRGGVVVDLLDQPAALTAWLRAQHHRLPWAGQVNKRDLTAVCALRDTVDNLLCTLREKRRALAADLNEFNRVLAQPGDQLCLSWAASGPYLVAPARHTKRAALLHTLATTPFRY